MFALSTLCDYSYYRLYVSLRHAKFLFFILDMPFFNFFCNLIKILLYVIHDTLFQILMNFALFQNCRVRYQNGCCLCVNCRCRKNVDTCRYCRGLVWPALLFPYPLLKLLMDLCYSRSFAYVLFYICKMDWPQRLRSLGSN